MDMVLVGLPTYKFFKGGFFRDFPDFFSSSYINEFGLGRAFNEEWRGKSLGLSSWREIDGCRPEFACGFLGMLAVALVKPENLN